MPALSSGGDFICDFVGLGYAQSNIPKNLADFVGDIHAVFGVIDRLLNQGSRVLCRISRTLCKTSHLFSNNGKTLACLARAGCFNRSIKRQQICLEGNFVYDLDNLGCLVKLFWISRIAIVHLIHCGAPGISTRFGFFRQSVSMLCVISVFLCHRGHFFQTG